MKPTFLRPPSSVLPIAASDEQQTKPTWNTAAHPSKTCSPYSSLSQTRAAQRAFYLVPRISSGLPRSLRHLGRHVGAAPQTSRKWRPPATETRGRQRRRSLSRFWPSGWTSARRRTPSPIARSQPTSPPSSPRYAPPASARPSRFDSSRRERNHAPSVASAVNSQF